MPKQPPKMVTIDEFFNLVQQIENELKNQTDRGVALIGALAVENEVDMVLRSVMVNHELPETGTQFKNKTDWAYQLGLISKEEHDEIVRVLQIRNKMAHEIGMHSFDRPPAKGRSVQELCTELTYCEKFYWGEGLSAYIAQWFAKQGEDARIEQLILPKELVMFPHGSDARQRFVGSVKALVSVLGVRKLLAQREDVPEPMSFDHLGELFDGKNQGLKNTLRLLPPERQGQWRQSMHKSLATEVGLINLIAASRIYHEHQEQRQ